MTTSRARRQAREPGLGGFFSRFALRRLQIPDEGVEPGVALARRLGDEVPFGRSDRVGRRAAARRQNAGEPVLRDRAALPRRLAEPGYRAGFVLGHPGPIEQSDGIFDLGVEVAGAGRGAEQPRGLARILGDAAALLVERRQRILRVGIAGVGGAAQQSRGPPRAARRSMASSNIASRSPRSTASENHANAFWSSLGTPNPLA